MTVVTGRCSIEGCEREPTARGWCRRHYQRWFRHGSTDLPQPRDPTYSTVHRQLRRTKGRASDYPCVGCGEQAAEWAYDHLDPNERTGLVHGVPRPYSANLDHYAPMCKTCHWRFDQQVVARRV